MDVRIDGNNPLRTYSASKSDLILGIWNLFSKKTASGAFGFSVSSAHWCSAQSVSVRGYGSSGPIDGDRMLGAALRELSPPFTGLPGCWTRCGGSHCLRRIDPLDTSMNGAGDHSG
jgi:hypothetical protein